MRLDRESEAVAFRADPDSVLQSLTEPILIDEWQLVPSVLGAVKRAVDADPHCGRFLLTGSVRADLESELWPGTGRVVRVPLAVMSIREQLGRIEATSFIDHIANGNPPKAPSDTPDLRIYIEHAIRSGFPEPALHLSPSAREPCISFR